MSSKTTSDDGTVYDCLDCGFIGTWLATGDSCPKCRSENIATKDSDRQEPTRSEPADFGGGESTGVQDL